MRTPTITDQEAHAALFGPPQKKNKFGAKKVEIDGYLFDSRAEASRYQQLKLLHKAGEIDFLTVHEQFVLEVYGWKVGVYTSDFTYVPNTGPNKDKKVVEDTKSTGTMNTEAFRLRARLFHACHGLQVTCTDGNGNVLAVLPKLPKSKATKKKGTTK